MERWNITVQPKQKDKYFYLRRRLEEKGIIIDGKSGFYRYAQDCVERQIDDKGAQIEERKATIRQKQRTIERGQKEIILLVEEIEDLRNPITQYKAEAVTVFNQKQLKEMV